MPRAPRIPPPRVRSPRGAVRRARRLVPALAIVALGGSPGCGGAGDDAAARGPEPNEVTLACAEPRADLGTVWEGTLLEHEFHLVARGPEPLVVRGVKADCGCTVAELAVVGPQGRVPYVEGRPLAPGTELVLAVSYDTTGKAGSHERAVKVFCNEPDGLAELVIEAEVRSRFRSEPDPTPGVVTMAGEPAEVRFDVVGVTDDPFRLAHEPLGVPPSVQVALEPVEPDDEGRATRWHVTVRLGPETPRGTHSYPIFVRATGLPEDVVDRPGGEPGTATFAPSVVARVLGLFSAEPQNLSFGAVALDETVSRTVRVSCNDPGFELVPPEVEIVPIAQGRPLVWTENATLSVRRVEGERAFDVEVLVRGLPEGTARRFLGTLLVRTGHPREPELRVVMDGLRADGGGR